MRLARPDTRTSQGALCSCGLWSSAACYTEFGARGAEKALFTIRGEPEHGNRGRAFRGEIGNARNAASRSADVVAHAAACGEKDRSVSEERLEGCCYGALERSTFDHLARTDSRQASSRSEQRVVIDMGQMFGA